MKPDAVVKRIALWATAFIAVASALGILNRLFIVDPIIEAVAEERVARVAADSTERIARVAAEAAILDKVSEIAERQAIFVGAATAEPGTPEWLRAQRFLRKNANRVIIR